MADDEEFHDMASEPAAGRRPAIPAAPAPPVAAKVLRYEAKHAAELDPDKLRDVQAPLLLVLGGLGVEFITAWWHAGTRGVPRAMAEAATDLLVSTAVMLAVVFVAARMRGFKLGPVGSAILKLMAVSLAPSAVMTVASLFAWMIPIFGSLALLGIGFCLYFALLGYFFELDQDDTWYCVIVIFLTKVTLFFTLPWIWG